MGPIDVHGPFLIQCADCGKYYFMGHYHLCTAMCVAGVTGVVSYGLYKFTSK